MRRMKGRGTDRVGGSGDGPGKRGDRGSKYVGCGKGGRSGGIRGRGGGN